MTDLATRLGAPIDGFEPPAHWTRKQLRSMGRVSQLAVRAASLPSLTPDSWTTPRYATAAWALPVDPRSAARPTSGTLSRCCRQDNTGGLNANSYVRMMPHTAAANVGIFFGLTGRIIPTSSACTSGSQGIGYACESIRAGRQTLMLAGGAEELCASEAIAFDFLYATSRRNDAAVNDAATLRPRPRRPGHRRRRRNVGPRGPRARARARGPHSCGGRRLRQQLGRRTRHPAHGGRRCSVSWRLPLADAGVSADAIGYVNGHGTATEHGDIAETRATVVAARQPDARSARRRATSATRWAPAVRSRPGSAIEMMKEGWFAPTLNLEHVDPHCGDLDYIAGSGRELDIEYVMNNNFAFGGVNTSLIFRNCA